MRVRHSSSRVLALAALALTCVAGPRARADDDSEPPKFEWLSPAREISRSWSASRDAPVLTMTVLPRPVLMGGGELALATQRWPGLTLRSGFGGFVELEFDGETDGFHFGPVPGSSTGQILWRGAYAFYAAVAPTKLGPRICQGCALEATLQYRHESQHYTGSNHGGVGDDVTEQPYVGDDVIVDVAFSQRVGDFYFAERAIGMWFLPERSSYAAGVGADLHARFIAGKWVHPFTSLYGEYLFGDDLSGRVYPDAYRLRGLLGVALPSNLGDVLVFGFGDVGHRYGVRILTEEATMGVGVRLAIGTQPR